MKLTNPNYCATIVRIKKTHPLDGCDNLVGISLFGYNIIAQKDINMEGLHILFTTETQLSQEYIRQNNLSSSSDLNKDVTIKGYIGKNRRIRAIKLRGHSSNAMLMPISSLIKLTNGAKTLKEGDTFNEIDGHELCKKYELPINKNLAGNKTKGSTKKYERIDGKHFPEHFSTEQWGRNEHKYSNEDILVVTQKLHGTSVRFGHVKTRIKPTLFDKLLRRERTEYDYLAGSRRVIKDTKSDRVFEHYYETHPGELDIYNRALATIKDVLPKDVMIYGEIVGWNNDSLIQKGYTYGETEGSFAVYVYRITSINSDGQAIDWGWDTIKGWCVLNEIKHVPELWRGKKGMFNVEDYLDVNYYHSLYKEKEIVAHDAPIVVDKSMVDEGICIRREGLSPYVTKAKSPIFFEYETKMLDEGVEIAS